MYTRHPSIGWAVLFSLVCISVFWTACSPSTPTELPPAELPVDSKDAGSSDKVVTKDGKPNAFHQIGKMSPEQCGKCHVSHYQDWSGSMHAYAAKDPIYIAMLKKGLEETKGKLGQFCIQCHSPTASKFKLVPIVKDKDGVHKPQLDMSNFLVSHGVQCVTCHSISKVTKTLNAGFVLSKTHYYGPTGSAASNKAHPMKKFTGLKNSFLCGTCHNVVNPKGALLENTFSEWYGSDFNSDDPAKRKTCQDCHMPSYKGEVTKGGPVKTLHRHRFVGVDQALIPGFPKKKEQAELVKKLLQSCARLTVERTEDVGEEIAIVASVRNINNGHNLPSGSTADRQVWVHLTIRDKVTKTKLFESGMLDKNGDLMDRIPGHSLEPNGDPFLLMFGQFLFDENGKHVTFPWQAKTTKDVLIAPGQVRWREYFLPKANVKGKTLEVTAILNYRTFPPFLIRTLINEGYLKKNAITPVPIIEMARVTKTFVIR